MEEDNNSYCFIQFKCTYPTNPNEDLYVSGNIKELGNWDIKKAEKLIYNKELYYHTSKNWKVKQGQEIQYRYLIFYKGVFSHWEEGLKEFENRALKINKSYMIVVNDKKGIIHGDVQHYQGNGIQLKSSDEEEEEESSPFDYVEENQNESKYNTDIRASLKTSDLIARKNSLHYLASKPFSKAGSIDSMNNQTYKDLQYSSDEEDNYQTTQEPKYQENIKKFSGAENVIIGCAYLPIEVEKNTTTNVWEIKGSSDSLYNIIYQISKKYSKVTWVGFLKNYYLIPEDEREQVVNLLKKQKLIFVKISEDLLMNYQEFMSLIFISLFQYYSLFSDLYSIKNYDKLWKAYKEFNDCVAKTIAEHLVSESLILIHDYNLLLTPSLIHHNVNILNNKNTKITNFAIGLFMHRPFPGVDVFNRFPHREEIIYAMMSCCSIFFHTYEATRNFISNCSKSVNINFESTKSGDLALSYLGRHIIIEVRHFHSEPALIREEMKKPEFIELTEQIRKKYKNKFIFVSMDLIYNKFFCLRNKLEGYVNFLRENGKKCEEENVFIQYIYFDEEFIYSKGNKEKLIMIRKEIQNMVTRIKNEFSADVIEVIEKKINYTERLAILSVSNCLVRANLRLGYPLDILDFLNLKLLKGIENEEFCYIFSEASASLISISGQINISPFDSQSISFGMQTAYQNHFDGGKLNPAQEKDLIHAAKFSASDWFITVFTKIKINQSFDDYYMGVDIGLQFKLMRISSNFKPLNKEQLAKDYLAAKHVLILLDFEGTLPQSKYYREYERKGCKPHEKTMEVLEQLSSDNKNSVFIITGREKLLVEEWFSSIKNLGLAAEHGFYYTFKSQGKWKSMLNDYNNSWRIYVAELLESYTERCEGSYIEVKDSSVVWQYRDCDKELGRNFANVLKSDLEHILSKYELNVINGKGYTEIKPKGLNKGGFASFILREFVNNKIFPELILCIGDDTSDEEMFRYFGNCEKNIKKYLPDVKVYCSTVGKKPSRATSYLSNQWEVNSLLEILVSTKKKKLEDINFKNVPTKQVSGKSLKILEELNEGLTQTTTHSNSYVSEKIVTNHVKI